MGRKIRESFAADKLEPPTMFPRRFIVTSDYIHIHTRKVSSSELFPPSYSRNDDPSTAKN